MALVRFFAAAKAVTKTSEIQVSGKDVSEVLTNATKKFPELSIVLKKCSILLNEVSCNDLKTVVSENDLVDVLPPFAGG
ncbi:MAG: hypothetical protein RLZZ571_691 [Actinomycetota bacterium]|jgi:molybdopterin converting factor small subunit